MEQHSYSTMLCRQDVKPLVGHLLVIETREQPGLNVAARFPEILMDEGTVAASPLLWQSKLGEGAPLGGPSLCARSRLPIP